MDFEATTGLSADAGDVLGAVADLATYPRWLGIVAAVEPADAHPEDAGPAWQVTLQARLGPLVRRKRLRMVRTMFDEAARRVRFERAEHDGDRHGTWVLTAAVDAATSATTLTIGLRYDGVGWIPGLDVLLRQEARRAGQRLARFLTAGD